MNQTTTEQKLSRIKRFLQSSAPLLLIIGDAQSTRSECLALLMQQMCVSRFLIAFKATAQLKPKFILNKFSQHWSANKIDRMQDIHTQLEQVVLNLIHHDQRALLLIDDADKLSASMLQIILHLTHIQEDRAPYLHIILAGSEQLAQHMHLLHHQSIPQLLLTPKPVPIVTPELLMQKIPPKKHAWTTTFLQMMQYLAEPREGAKGQIREMTKRKRISLSRKRKMRVLACCGLIVTGLAMWWYDGQNTQWQAQHDKIQLAQKSAAPAAKPITLAQTKPLNKPFVIIQAHPNQSKEKPLIIVKQQAPSKQSKPLLLATKPGYTLQLLGSHHKNAVQTFIKQHHLANTHIIKSKYGQQSWYALTYGHYNTHKQALQAKTKLSAGLKKLHPWIRRDA